MVLVLPNVEKVSRSLLLDMPSSTTSLQRSALATCGCRDIAELQQCAVLEPQSEASLRDAAIRGMEPATAVL